MLVSPLRYPGGKARLFEYFAEIVKENDLYRSTYCEPYAGGAGLALKLLSTGFVERIALNDLDKSIFAFWKAVLHNTDKFCDLVEGTPITVDEWHRQKAIWLHQDLANPLQLGFATFFLNRTNRSGIIDGAGPIGGYQQEGSWKLDARLKKAQQIKNVQVLGAFSDKIALSNVDALKFLKGQLNRRNTFCYLDPPYYVKGSKLYRNFYRHSDHCDIFALLHANRNAKWIVSYDDVPQVRHIYAGLAPISYALSYSVGAKATGREVIYFSDRIRAPSVRGFKREAA